MYLNLELNITNNNHEHHHAIYDYNDKKQRQYFGRIIFHTEDVDRLYSYFKSNEHISSLISFENEPTNAPWSERYFHIREPDGYQFHLQCLLLIKKIKTKPLKLKTAISYHNRNLLLAPISSWIRWRQECTIRFLILPGLLVWH